MRVSDYLGFFWKIARRKLKLSKSFEKASLWSALRLWLTPSSNDTVVSEHARHKLQIKSPMHATGCDPLNANLCAASEWTSSKPTRFPWNNSGMHVVCCAIMTAMSELGPPFTTRLSRIFPGGET
jgi:hypothetical protein